MYYLNLLRNPFIFKRLYNPASGELYTLRWSATVAQTKDFNDVSSIKSFDDIPGFKIFPLIGSSWVFFPLIGRYKMSQLHLAMKDKKRLFGDLVRDKLGKFNVVVSYKPEDVEEVFKNEGPLPDRGEVESVKKYRKSRNQWYTTSGFMTSQGEEWWDLRSKVQKPLMKPKAVQAYLNPMQEVARDFVKKVRRDMDAKGEIPELLAQLYKWSLESVTLIGLDTRLGCLDPNLPLDSDGMKMINSVQTQFETIMSMEAIAGNLPLWKYFPTKTWNRFILASDTFSEIAFKYINRSLDNLKKNEGNVDKEITLLQSLILTKGLDVSGAMVTVADLILAGIDTTSHSVGFFLYNMAKNPEAQEKLYQHIKTLLPSKDDKVTQDVFNGMQYLKACIKESQRLSPIGIGVARKVQNDVVLNGYRVPAGTLVILALQEIGIDPRYFPEPEKFLPERWLDKEQKPHPFALLPFGFGTKSCLGRRLAELEIICLLTEMIRNFRLEYHYEDIGYYTKLVLSPDKPLRIKFIER